MQKRLIIFLNWCCPIRYWYFIFLFIFQFCSSEEPLKISLNWEYAPSRKEDSLFQSLEKEFKPLGKEKSTQVKKGYTWFRAKFLLPKHLKKSQLTALFQKFQWEREIYLNGHLISSNLKRDSHWNFRGNSELVSIPGSYLQFELENTFLVKLYSEEDPGIPKEIYIANENDLSILFFIYSFFEKNLYLLISIICLFFFFLLIQMYYISEKGKYEYSYLAFSFLFFSLTSCYTIFSIFRISTPDNIYTIISKFEFLLYFTSIFYLYKFISKSSKISDNEIEYYIIEIYAICGILLFLFAGNISNFTIPLSVKYFLHLPILFLIIFKISGGASKQIPICLTLYPLSLFLVFGIIFNISNLFLKYTNYSLEYYLVFITLLISISHLILENQRKQKQYKIKNLHTETLLKEKNNFISDLHFQIEDIKNKINSEYFMMGLLSQSLGKSDLKSSYYSFETYLEQLTKVVYKNQIYEIGGDTCITRYFNFFQEKKKYIFFINADSTGKSIKGAIGRITSMIYFEHLLKTNQKSSPDIFLRTSLENLSELIKIFDGNIFISCSAGVIEESSGRLYYAVVGNPKIILYRDNKTEYLMNSQNELLGSQELRNIRISQFQLQKNDKLFISSDGRESIELGGIYGGVRSETESLFLKIIESTNGELNRIIPEFKGYGRFSDDFSILAIKCEETESINDSSFEDNSFDVRIKGDNYFHIKNYKSALEQYEELAREGGSAELFMRIGLCHKHLKNYPDAIQFMEKAQTYDSSDITILLHLCDTYRLSGNIEKAKEVFREAGRIIPHIPQIIKLNQILEEQI